MTDSFPLIIESCYDCPRLKISTVEHWMLGHQKGYRYDCERSGKQIAPSDGVTPPPPFCPKRP
ncbi:MAG: hypothetical protein WC341_00680, partial [Bacteroidales bacterium]